MADQSSQQFLRELDKKLWSAADKLRANLDAAVYKHAVLGLIFLKYVSDSFAVRQAEIEAQLRDPQSDYFLDPADYGGEGQRGIRRSDPRRAGGARLLPREECLLGAGARALEDAAG
jgi:type I restriction-modification system DNA methylase subunit